MRPRIGITCSYRMVRTIGGVETPQLRLDARFFDMTRRAGGRPILLAPPVDPAELDGELCELDGIILTGGPDVPPARYGAAPHEATKEMHPRRVASDFRVAAFADANELPLLAICAGIQQWNVHRGGTLHQHVPDLPRTPKVAHRDANGEDFAFHPVRVAPDSLLRTIVETDPLPVNSSHHQGLDRLGEHLVATAWAPDGLVEAVEDPRRHFCLGVQWHPEDLPDDPLQQRLFDALVRAAGRPASR